MADIKCRDIARLSPFYPCDLLDRVWIHLFAEETSKETEDGTEEKESEKKSPMKVASWQIE